MSQPVVLLRVKRRRDEDPLETITLANNPAKQSRHRDDVNSALVNIFSSLDIVGNEQTETTSSGFIGKNTNLSRYLPPSTATTLFDTIRAQSNQMSQDQLNTYDDDIPDTNISIVAPRKSSSPPKPVLISPLEPKLEVIGILSDAAATSEPATQYEQPPTSTAPTAAIQPRSSPPSSVPAPTTTATPVVPPGHTVVYRRVATLPPLAPRTRKHTESPTRAATDAADALTGDASASARRRKRQQTDAAHAALLKSQLQDGALVQLAGTAAAAESLEHVSFVDVGVAERAADLRQQRKHKIELAKMHAQRAQAADALATAKPSAPPTTSTTTATVLRRGPTDASVLDALYGTQTPSESYEDEADRTLTGALYERYCRDPVRVRGGKAVYDLGADTATAGMDEDTAAFLQAKRMEYTSVGTKAKGGKCTGKCGRIQVSTPSEDERVAALFAKGQATSSALEEDDDAFLARMQAQPLGSKSAQPAEAISSSTSAGDGDGVCSCECTVETESEEDAHVFDVYEAVVVPNEEAAEMSAVGVSSAAPVCVLTGAELEELFGEEVEVLLHEGEWGYGRDEYDDDGDVDGDLDAAEIDYPDEDDSDDSGMDEYDAEEAEFVMRALRMRRDDSDDEEEEHEYGVSKGFRQSLPQGVRVGGSTGGSRESWGFIDEASDEDDEYGGSNTFARMRRWAGASGHGEEMDMEDYEDE